ncbi:hypothetical protein GUJ93_ZPchr0005g14993 [Zizania palustris]|uniref:Secreted protein n=1 Tax=Zizania palustris TaxID=103762 RepID=A0A8J5W0T7_ZIZPA|nr:hypothetical protein GUJ93_ZPchr0005g14993 [Zizania palustris]
MLSLGGKASLLLFYLRVHCDVTGFRAPPFSDEMVRPYERSSAVQPRQQRGVSRCSPHERRNTRQHLSTT